MKLEGGERLVLKSLLDLQGDSGDYVEDSRLAAATKMLVQDVRDWLETLEGKGFVERSRGTEGFSAYVTAKGKQALRLTEPISSPKPAAAVVGSGGSSVAAPSGAEESISPRHASSTPKTSGPIRLFYSYSHKDEELRNELEEHLSLLKRQGYLLGWHDRRIGAGEEWRGQLDRNLEEAQVILLLISPSFLASDYCYDIETKRALERHDRDEARVIPILLRPVDWEGAPFSRLQGLPIDLRPVTTWSNRDEAFRNIAQGIRRVVEVMRQGGTQRRFSHSAGCDPEPFSGNELGLASLEANVSRRWGRLLS